MARNRTEMGLGRVETSERINIAVLRLTFRRGNFGRDKAWLAYVSCETVVAGNLPEPYNKFSPIALTESLASIVAFKDPSFHLAGFMSGKLNGVVNVLDRPMVGVAFGVC